MLRTRLIKRLAPCLLPLCLASCAWWQDKPEVTVVTLQFSIAEDANPDDFKRASPVVLAMHQLRQGSSYLQADLIQLFQDSSTALGSELISTQKFGPFFPGTEAREKIILSNEAHALGFLAEVSRLDAAHPRSLLMLSLEEPEELTIRVHIDRNGVTAYRTEEE